MESSQIPCKIERTKRSGYCIMVKDGVVTVRVPLYTTDVQALRIIEDKRAWIERKITQSRLSNQRFEPLKQLTHILIFGHMYKIVFDKTKTPVLQEDRLVLPMRYDDNPSGLQRVVKKFLKGLADEYLTAELANKPYSYNGYTLSNARSKWASCTADNRLSFNWRIACLPPVLIDYLIIHELCHTVHHNHSAAYWGLVESHLPEYKKLRKGLKEFSALTELYR